MKDIHTVFFDLDDTLYQCGDAIHAVMRERIRAYFVEHLGIAGDGVDDEVRRLYLTYGTTLRGLMKEHPKEIDPDQYLAFVHDPLPLQAHVKPEDGLRDAIQAIDKPKWVFTASVAEHAHRCLDLLGIRDLFQGIIDCRAVNFHTKHEAESFRRAAALAGVPDGARCLFIDDSLTNLETAKSFGWTTVWVKNERLPVYEDKDILLEKRDFVDHHVPFVSHIRSLRYGDDDELSAAAAEAASSSSP